MRAEDFPKILGDKRAEELRQKYAKAREENIDRGWDGLLSFAEMLELSIYYELLHLKSEERGLVAEVRNRVAHTDRRWFIRSQTLVSSSEHV